MSAELKGILAELPSISFPDGTGYPNEIDTVNIKEISKTSRWKVNRPTRKGVLLERWADGYCSQRNVR